VVAVNRRVACLRRDRELFNTEFSVACAKFLAFMCDTEHFQTHHKAYFADEEAMAAFVALQEEVIAPLLSDRAVERKEIRPLMDAVLSKCTAAPFARLAVEKKKLWKDFSLLTKPQLALCCTELKRSLG